VYVSLSDNKEFEEWKNGPEDMEPVPEDGDYFECKFRQAFEAGQQSERDKHRWIPVTERLPTEKDGRKFLIKLNENDLCDHVCQFQLNSLFPFYYENNINEIMGVFPVFAWQSIS
jgi:hypothetical protein